MAAESGNTTRHQAAIRTFEYVRLRIEESKALVHEVRVAAAKAKRLVCNAEERLRGYRAWVDGLKSTGDGKGTLPDIVRRET